MSGNPLVAGVQDSTTPFSGAGLLDDGAQIADAIQTGNWVEGGLAAFSTGVDVAATVSDPLGSLIAHGLGWLIDHFEPLKGWFDDLTGDHDEVAAFAQTWTNVGGALHDSGTELTRILGDLDDLHGATIDSYRRFQTDAAAHLNASGDWAAALGTGLQIASTLVQLVHDLVRDAISQLVGSAISWAAEEVFSLGLATPWVVEQVSTRCASLATKIGTKVPALVRIIQKLAGLLEKLKSIFDKAGELTAKVLRRGGKDADEVPTRTGAHASDHPGDDAGGGATTTHPGDGTPPVDDRPYLDPSSRPSFRKGVVDEVWENAKGADGKVRDPNTGDVIEWTPGDSRKGVWDMGHLPEAKYSEMHQRYLDGELTPKQFRDWYNDPDNYRPETPSANRSHRYE